MNKSQQSALQRLAVTALVTIASAVTAVTAQAAYIATATEVGGDVVFEGAGSINLTDLSLDSSGNYVSFIDVDTGVGLGLSRGTIYTSLTGFAGPSTVGLGTTASVTHTETGDYTALWWSSPNITVPEGYTSAKRS
jgi:hypothetical protein